MHGVAALAWSKKEKDPWQTIYIFFLSKKRKKKGHYIYLFVPWAIRNTFILDATKLYHAQRENKKKKKNITILTSFFFFVNNWLKRRNHTALRSYVHDCLGLRYDKEIQHRVLSYHIIILGATKILRGTPRFAWCSDCDGNLASYSLTIGKVLGMR